MNEQQVLMTIGISLVVIPIALIIWVVYWLKKNDINVQISTQKEGAYLSSGGRYRIVGDRLYPVSVLFSKFSDNYLSYDKMTENKIIKKKPITLFGGRLMLNPGKEVTKTKTYNAPVLVSDIKDYFMVTEGWPLIGVKLSLKLKRKGSKLIPWLPQTDLSEVGVTSNTRMVKINDLRFQLYESTRTPMTKEDLLLKVALPMGMIMLAIILIIFFPKMYHAITTGSKGAFDSSKEAVFNWLGQNAPNG